jgi:hypothetical protein
MFGVIFVLVILGVIVSGIAVVMGYEGAYSFGDVGKAVLYLAVGAVIAGACILGLTYMVT